MTGKERRSVILRALEESDVAIKGSEFSKKLGVSRQVIVQDIALLRAEGVKLIGSPGGYKLKEKSKGIKKIIATKHNSDEKMEEELRIILNNDSRVIDIVVEHEIFGEIRANLHINTEEELKSFMEKIADAEPLSSITGGVHLHTIEVPSEEHYKKIISDLAKADLLNID